MKQNMFNKYKKETIFALVSTVLIVISINIIASFFWFRADITKDKRHSLSAATIEMLKNLKENVYIKVYLKGDNLPADYEMFAKSTKEMLQTFKSYSKKVRFEFIDPIKNKKNQEVNSILGEFARKGLNPVPLTTETSAGYMTQYVVPGAMIYYNNVEFPVTLVVSDPSGDDSWQSYSTQELEYNFSAAIRNIIKQERPKVAFIEGHGEFDFLTTSWISFQLHRFYNVERVKIDGKINSLRNIAINDTVNNTLVGYGTKYEALIIAQPKFPFSDIDKYILDQYVMNGGKILWLIDQTTASTDSFQYSKEYMAMPRNLRLNDLFFHYGVRINANILQDLSCQSIPVSAGTIGEQTQYKFVALPYALNIVNFSTHPITRNLKKIKSDFISSIDFVGKQELNKTILMTSSEKTKMTNTPTIVTLNVGFSKPNMQEFQFHKLPVAVLVEGVFESAFKGLLPIEFDTVKQFGFKIESKPTRQIFVADGDIIRNRVDKTSYQPFPAGYDIYTKIMYDNSLFVMNCINYLCADEDLLSIRAKNFKTGSLNKTKIQNDGITYAVINIAIPLLIIMLLGIFMNVFRKFIYKKK